MTITEVLTFFDEKKLCPQSVENCNQLRENYLLEVTNAKISGCTECQIMAVRDKYVKILLKK
jgi:hypothetical protein